MGKTKKSWKQSGVWGTAFADKYEHDIFFRTRASIILLHVLTILVALVVFGAFLYFSHARILSAFLDMLETALRGGKAGEQALEIATGEIRDWYFALSAVLVVGAGGVAYVLSGIVLRRFRRIVEGQKRFLSDISHELRTPLSIARADAEIALSGEDGEEWCREALVSNLEELKRLSNILDNLSVISRIDGPRQIDFFLFSFSDMVRAAAEKLKPLAEKKSIAFSVSHVESALAYGNETALAQVVINLLKNAIHYTPEGGSVDVSVAEKKSGGVEFIVRDTGIGISRKDLPHIFEPFYKADTSRTIRSESAGLGLAIVSDIVSLHRGEIFVDSSPQKGTEVVVTLPSEEEAYA